MIRKATRGSSNGRGVLKASARAHVKSPSSPARHRRRCRVVPAFPLRTRRSDGGSRKVLSCALPSSGSIQYEAGETVDALCVSAGPVLGHLLGSLAFCRVQQLLAGSQQLHARNAVPARARDPAHRHVNDRPLTRQVRETEPQLLEIGVAGFMNSAVTLEADYLRWVDEGAEHEGYAPVCPEVGYGLDAASGEVEPC